MMEKKVCFWLYKGNTRVTGIYGLFCQFTNEPKVYTLSDEQKGIVLGNLKAKLERIVKTPREPQHLGDAITMLADRNSNDATDFDQVRIYTVGDELVESYVITNDGGSIEFLKVEAIKDTVIRLIAKIEGVSQTRVPYTYHHDYVRTHFPGSLSRADVAQSSRNCGDDELYSLTLAYLIKPMEFMEVVERFDAKELNEIKRIVPLAKEFTAKRIEAINKGE